MDHQAFAQLLGNYGEFVGAIAVVTTLAYLAYQIRQNTRQIEFEIRTTEVAAYQEITSRVVNTRQAMMTDTDLLATLIKAERGENFDDIERRRYGAYVSSMIANCDSAYFQYMKGMLTPDRLDALCAPLFRHIRRHKPGLSMWQRIEHEYVAEFRAYLNHELEAEIEKQS